MNVVLPRTDLAAALLGVFVHRHKALRAKAERTMTTPTRATIVGPQQLRLWHLVKCPELGNEGQLQRAGSPRSLSDLSVVKSIKPR